MAQHIPIENFPQKQVQKIAESIRKDRYFLTSMKYEKLSYADKETPDDEVYGTERSAPKSITGRGREFFEVHTKPYSVSDDGSVRTTRRIATNIYLVA